MLVGVEESRDEDERYTEYTTTAPDDDDNEDGNTIDYRTGVGFLQAARNVQRKSKEYWLFEYLRRRKENQKRATRQVRGDGARVRRSTAVPVRYLRARVGAGAPLFVGDGVVEDRGDGVVEDGEYESEARAVDVRVGKD